MLCLALSDLNERELKEEFDRTKVGSGGGNKPAKMWPSRATVFSVLRIKTFAGTCFSCLLNSPFVILQNCYLHQWQQTP